jgi:hypothetical protein
MDSSWVTGDPIGIYLQLSEQIKGSGALFSLLSFLRWDRLDLGREARMHLQIHRMVLHRGARRIYPKKVVIVPIHRRSDRSRDKPAAAIWADISQNAFDAEGAEGALIGADARLKRIRRQRLVAVFAGRSKFKHGTLNVKLPETDNQWFLKHFLISTMSNTQA